MASQRLPQEDSKIAAEDVKLHVEDIAIEVKNLTFRFTPADPIVLTDFSLAVPRGSRCLVVGDNGAGACWRRWRAWCPSHRVCSPSWSLLTHTRATRVCGRLGL